MSDMIEDPFRSKKRRFVESVKVDKAIVKEQSSPKSDKFEKFEKLMTSQAISRDARPKKVIFRWS